MKYVNNTNLRLIFYNYMKEILDSDKAYYPMLEFRKSIHGLLKANYNQVSNQKKYNFDVGDTVILSDLAIVNFFPKSLGFIPLCGKVTNTGYKPIGNNCVDVFDQVTKSNSIINCLYIKKSNLNKLYILKLLTMVDVCRKASRGIKLDFLSKEDIKILASAYKDSKRLFPNEIEVLESLADIYLSLNDRVNINNKHIEELKEYFRLKLVSYFYKDELEENVDLALRTYYQLYENTIDEYSRGDKFLLAHFVVQSFEYDFFSKNKTLISKERLLFTRVMNIAYNFLARNKDITFERLKRYIVLILENLENNHIQNNTIDNAILMSINNFKREEKRYYK